MNWKWIESMELNRVDEDGWASYSIAAYDEQGEVNKAIDEWMNE